MQDTGCTTEHLVPTAICSMENIYIHFLGITQASFTDTVANVLPINKKSIKLCRFVTYWTHPCRLFLVHLEKRCGIKTLQMRAGACSTRRTHSHLAKL